MNRGRIHARAAAGLAAPRRARLFAPGGTCARGGRASIARPKVAQSPKHGASLNQEGPAVSPGNDW